MVSMGVVVTKPAVMRRVVPLGVLQAGSAQFASCPVNPDDPGKLQSYAFSYGYMEGLLRAAKEEAIRATRA